jgi:hypothetical protein
MPSLFSASTTSSAAAVYDLLATLGLNLLSNAVFVRYDAINKLTSDMFQACNTSTEILRIIGAWNFSYFTRTSLGRWYESTVAFPLCTRCCTAHTSSFLDSRLQDRSTSCADWTRLTSVFPSLISFRSGRILISSASFTINLHQCTTAKFKLNLVLQSKKYYY